MTSARQNRKSETIVSPWRNKFNNIQTNSLCKKCRNQLRLLHLQTSVKLAAWKPVTKSVALTRAPAHGTTWYDQRKICNSWLIREEGKKRLKYISNVQTFPGATRRTGFCLS